MTLAFIVGLFHPVFLLHLLFRCPNYANFGLICSIPLFLQPLCFSDSVLFGNVPSFILTRCPVHIIQFFTVFSQRSLSDPISFFVTFIIFVSTLFTPAIPSIISHIFRCTLACLHDICPLLVPSPFVCGLRSSRQQQNRWLHSSYFVYCYRLALQNNTTLVLFSLKPV